MKTPEDDPTSIGNILLRMGLVTRDQLESVMSEQVHMREDLLMGNLMVAKGLISKEQLEVALAAQKGMRSGGRSGQALAVADVCLTHTTNNRERRARMLEKGAAVEQGFLRLVHSRRA